MSRIYVAAPALIATMLLSVGTGGCGGAGKSTASASRVSSSAAKSSRVPPRTASSTTPTPRHLNNDGDNDEDDNGNGIRNYGEAASAVDNRAITALVKRYYAAAATRDGAKACSLLNPALAKAVPEDYGKAPGPTYLRGGKTCRAVLSMLFKHNRAQLAGGTATLDVTSVRVKGNLGYALLLFKTLPDERQIMVDREHGVWKIGVLIDSELP